MGWPVFLNRYPAAFELKWTVNTVSRNGCGRRVNMPFENAGLSLLVLHLGARWGGWSASRSGRYTSGKEPRYRWATGPVWTDIEKRKSYVPYRDLDPEPSSPLPNRHTYYAVPGFHSYYIRGHYSIWQLPSVSSCCYSSASFGCQMSGPRQYFKTSRQQVAASSCQIK